MPAGIATPVTLGTTYADDGTLGPFQEVDEIIFQFTGGPVAFQFGSVDPSGAVRFDNQEIFYPPGAWAFRNIKGIRFRSIAGQTAVTLQAAVAFFTDDPEPFTPGNVPGSVSLTSTLNFQHNDIFVASEPTLDFEDSGSLVWNLTDDNVNSRMKLSGSVTGFVPTHSVGTPGSTTLLDSEVTGDTNPRFTIDLTGSFYWGPGNAAQDVILGRNSTGALFLLNPPFGSGNLSAFFPDTVWAGGVNNTSTSNPAFQASINSDSVPRWQVNADGKIQWGPGVSAALDTDLFRNGVGSLTSTSFLSSNGYQANTGGIWSQRTAVTNVAFAAFLPGDAFDRWEALANGQLNWGTGALATDVSLFRAVLNTVALLQTNNGFSNGGVPNDLTSAGWVVWSNVQSVVSTASGNNVFVTGVQNDATYRFLINAAGQISWGPGTGVADTNTARVTNAPPNGAVSPALATNQIIWCNNNRGFITTSTVNNFIIRNFFLNTDANPSFAIFAQGAMEWGAGGASAPDIELARIVNSPTGTGSFLEVINGDGFGYGTGTGGTVTQTTSLNTGVTINKPTGAITLFTTATGAGSLFAFTVTNSVVGADDTVIVSLNAASSNGDGFIVAITGVNAGSFRVSIYTPLATASATRILNYSVIKAARA